MYRVAVDAHHLREKWSWMEMTNDRGVGLFWKGPRGGPCVIQDDSLDMPIALQGKWLSNSAPWS